jgi:hypothetical protein
MADGRGKEDSGVGRVMERERNGRVGRSERREEREKWEELWALSGSYFLINRRISTLLVCGN